jgi:dihydrolipoamide dehydrogenase
VTPDIAGLDSLGDGLWSSVDALTAQERPDRLVILGGGVIGCELGLAFARLGTTVTLLDADPHGFPDLSNEVGDLVDAGLRLAGVTVRRGCGAVGFLETDGLITVDTDDGDGIVADRVLVAVGKRARVDGIGLEALGLDPAAGLEVDETGRVQCVGSVWAMGYVAGRGQYTHLANHQARVVADQLAGGRTRRFDDVAISSCVFTDPPVIQVGPSRADLAGDPDVIWATGRVSDLPRASTDDLGEGLLAIAARRSTGCIVAAHGAGPRFEELVHALVIAVDGAVPLDRLAMSMHAFPTVGEILGPVYQALLNEIQTH